MAQYLLVSMAVRQRVFIPGLAPPSRSTSSSGVSPLAHGTALNKTEIASQIREKTPTVKAADRFR